MASPKSWAEVDQEANRVEIEKLRKILRRWQTHSRYLFDCRELGRVWVSAELEGIIKNTNEVLDGEGTDQ